MLILDREELSWAAGFFDGEGTTYSNRGVPRLNVPQADPRPIDRFKAAIGGIGHVRIVPPPKLYPTRKQQWHWDTTSFEHAQAALAMLWSFLSRPKREQALKAFKAYGGGQPRWKCKRGHLRIAENIYPWGGRRACLICRRDGAREYMRGKRAAARGGV